MLLTEFSTLNRTFARSVLITSAALLPLLARSAAAEPIRAPDVTPQPAVTQSLLPDDLGTDPLMTESFEDDFPPPPPPEPRHYSTPLSKAVNGQESSRKLDWRTPQTELRFDLSHVETVQSLSLTLSADPLPGVDPDMPIYLQFNGSNPIEIETRGQGFDTTIALDPLRVRETGNVLRLSHAATCDAVGGGYRLALDESRLDLSVLPRAHRLQLREVEARFANPTFAPKAVGLVAGGDGQTKLHALAAQGIGVRLNHVPEFTLSSGEADFDLIMVPRAQLVDYTGDPEILQASGPAIVLPDRPSNRLFLTGDTQAEVLQSVQAFASAFLPETRRSVTNPEEVLTQSPLDVDRKLIDRRATLDLLTVQTGHARQFIFDVADPAASSGELILRLNRGRQTRKGTRLAATLNGTELGEAVVRGRRMSVAYPIDAGLLTGTGNRLELTTRDASNRPRCGESAPFIAIAEGSELRLNVENPSLETDLSRFAANGSLFSENAGADTTLVLPERDRDYTPSLSVLARMAQASGRGWINARFARGDAEPDTHHRLIIEPHVDIERAIRLRAPRGLQSAWRGHSPDSLDTVRQFASLDGEETVRQAASLNRDASPIAAGGVAAIYPGENGKLIGVFSNTGEMSLRAALAPLSDDHHWNGLSGAVTRWTDDEMVMAQTALPLPADLNLSPTLPSSEVSDFSGVTQPFDADNDLDPVSNVAEVANINEAVEPTPRPKVSERLASVNWPTVDLIPAQTWVNNRADELAQRFAREPEVQNTDSQNTGGQNTGGQNTDGENTRRHHIRLADATPNLSNARLPAPVLDRVQSARTHIAQTSTSLRSGLWAHLQIPEPSLRTARLGQGHIIQLILLLASLFFILLIGTVLASPPKQNIRTDRS